MLWRIVVAPLFFPGILLAPSVAIETILFKSILLSSRHFCTAFAISSPLVCPESGSNPRSSSYGPCEKVYLTKRAKCAASYMSQDSSTASDKGEESWIYSACKYVTFEDILVILSYTVLADSGKSSIFFKISSLFLKSIKKFLRCTYDAIFDTFTICDWFAFFCNF